jgi:predicted Zn-dependent protease
VRITAVVVVLCAWLCSAPCSAAPFVPADDATVLERLPEKSDPSLKALKPMRARLAADPNNLDVAATLARRAIEAARERGDPRFLGLAQAALQPWWVQPDAPATALLLRATIKQSQHDFPGALRDLDRLIAREPTHAQARLTRATVLTVQGRYADARRDCDALAGRASALVVVACEAAAASLSGDDERAYATLSEQLQRSREDPGVRVWAATLAAEIAARRGDFENAQRHFAFALAIDRDDAYLKAAYADFLIERHRAAAALPVLGSDVRNDALLLRIALAEQQAPSFAVAFQAHRAELAARFDAARRRGDVLHRREEARYRLAIENDAPGALALAVQNWAVQREPADLLILAQAARAAHDAAVLVTVREWISATGLHDRQVAAALEGA